MAESQDLTTAEAFLHHAQRDLQFARYALDGHWHPECCEHAHDSAEQSLKALQFHIGLAEATQVIRSHNVPALHLILLPHLPSLQQLDAAINVFKRYDEYVKYARQTVPPALRTESYGETDAEAAMSAAEEVLKAAQQIIESAEGIISKSGN